MRSTRVSSSSPARVGRSAPSAPLPEPRAPLVDVQGLKVHFFTRTGVVRAVDGIAYAVAPRETLGLVGESGSGKTVSGLSLLRLAPPPARIVDGRILFRGEDLIAKSERQMGEIRGRQIAMVFQNPAYSLNPIYSIGAQLGEILRWHMKVGRKEAEERVMELLRLVGIGDAASRMAQFPHELSGGMKQRICIARALLCNPALVLADEPTTNLDVTIQAQILDLLNDLKERLHTAMILVSHDMGVVAKMADRVTVMYAGRICETADARTIFSDPQHPYTRMLLESMPRVDKSYTGRRRPRLVNIPGRPPDLADPPRGCRFHPRCPEAGPECRELLPEMAPVAPGHAVSCLKRNSPGTPS